MADRKKLAVTCGQVFRCRHMETESLAEVRQIRKDKVWDIPWWSHGTVWWFPWERMVSIDGIYGIYWTFDGIMGVCDDIWDIPSGNQTLASWEMPLR